MLRLEEAGFRVRCCMPSGVEGSGQCEALGWSLTKPIREFWWVRMTLNRSL